MTNSKLQPQSSIRIIKKGTCSSILPNSDAKLSYDIGYNGYDSDDSSGDILFRVTGNTGGGYMNTTYWSLKDVTNILASAPDEIHLKNTYTSSILTRIDAIGLFGVNKQQRFQTEYSVMS